MTLLTIKNNKLYYITFSALNNTYNSFFPKIHRAISSIKFINSSTNNITNLQDKQNKNYSNKRDNYSNSNREFNLSQLNNIKTQSYEFIDMGIGITPPYGWSKEDMQESDKNNLIIFKSPFSDEKSKELSYHETTITMALAIDSLQHDRVTDYRVMYSKEKDANNNNDTHWHWVTKFMEVSANDKERIIEKSNSSDFFDKKNQNPPGYTLFSLDLDKINYPQQYRVLFYITDYFVLSHLYCRLVDTTNWVMIPPPLFEISTKPSSLTLRP